MDPNIYPIGKYVQQDFSFEILKERLLDIQSLPTLLEYSILNIDEFQLNTSYREGGWTIKQIVHHLADSHMNAYIRCKLALTEESPIIKPYNQDDWALMPDGKEMPVNVSITLLHALHLRWHEMFLHVNDSDWERFIVHPEYNREMSLWFILGLYAWHGKHHVEQIQQLRRNKGWS
jgi:hypothetical protein